MLPRHRRRGHRRVPDADRRRRRRRGFQVSTGRMPAVAPGVQIPQKPNTYTPEEIAALAAYVASLGAGPAIPTAADLDYSGADLAVGGVLFPYQLRPVPQLRRQGRCPLRGARTEPDGRDTDADVRGDAARAAEHAGVLQPDADPRGGSPSSSTRYSNLREAPDPGGLALVAVRLPRACSSGWPGSVCCRRHGLDRLKVHGFPEVTEHEQPPAPSRRTTPGSPTAPPKAAWCADAAPGRHDAAARPAGHRVRRRVRRGPRTAISLGPLGTFQVHRAAVRSSSSASPPSSGRRS